MSDSLPDYFEDVLAEQIAQGLLQVIDELSVHTARVPNITKAQTQVFNRSVTVYYWAVLRTLIHSLADLNAIVPTAITTTVKHFSTRPMEHVLALQQQTEESKVEIGVQISLVERRLKKLLQ